MNRSFRRGQQGLSLIELMIAVTLGMILTLGLIQVFIASRNSYAVAEGLSRVQENARFAIDAIQRDLRMAGHYGCVNDQFRLQRAGQLDSHFAANGALDFSRSIQGYEAAGTAPGASVNLAAPASGWTPALPGFLTGLNPAPRAGSDVIVVRFLSGEGVPVSGVGSGAASDTVTIDPGKWSVLTGGGNATPTLFGVADCTFADVFQGTTVNPATGTVTAKTAGLNVTAVNFDTRYTASPAGQTVLYRADAVAYYVANGAGGGPSLYRVRLAGTTATTVPEELVEGIESLQLLYGRDQSDQLDRLTGNIALQDTAAALLALEPQWRRVGQIRVGVLARSADPSSSLAAQQSPRLLGTTLAPPVDGRYRAAYESTVALRNRLYSNN